MGVLEDIEAVDGDEVAVTGLLIDTDVHEGLKGGVEALTPYMPAVWHPFLVKNSPWGKAPLLGLHGALRYAAPTPDVRPEWRESGTRDSHDVELSKKHLFVEEGVTHAILNGGNVRMGSMRQDPELCVALARAYNDWQIENWLDRDRRFLGSVHIVPDEPAVAAAEIDRVAAHPQVVQVFLPTVTDRQFGDPFYHPIYEAALRNDLVVAFHHGGETPTAYGFPRYYVEWHTLAAPQATQSVLNSLIFNGVFDKYPTLTVVLQEGGIAWVPWFMGRADQQFREARSGVPWVKRLPSEHIRENVRFTTQPITDVSPKYLASQIEAFSLERAFMFSTDYPHYDGDSVAVLDGLPDTMRRMIQYENALESIPRLRALVDA